MLVRNRRRWGGWLAHAGIALVVIAIAGTAWTQTTTRDLHRGDVVRIGGYELTYRNCTPSANLAITRSLDEGAKLARDIATRYGN